LPYYALSSVPTCWLGFSRAGFPACLH